MASDLQQITAVLGEGLVGPGTPIVDGDDLGLTRGHGCFDATRVQFTPAGPVIDLLDEHLARLRRSATALGIDAPADAAWIELVTTLTDAWEGEAEAGLKLVLTGGGETAPSTPVAYATLTELGPSTFDARRAGVAVVTLSRGVASDAYREAPWLLGGVKTIAYAVNVAAKEEAHRRGADDALFVSTDGYALEGPTSAIVIRRANTLLTTPAGDTGILPSITVDHIEQEAPTAGCRLERALFTPRDIVEADGAWFVSSVRGVAPIRRLDGVELPVDHEGDHLVRIFRDSRRSTDLRASRRFTRRT